MEVDVSGQIVGRVATKIAMALMGKDKPDFTPHIDSGAKIVVSNIDRIKFSGKKFDQKEYRHHSMHPGGLKIKTAKILIKTNPKEILIHAVERMLPKNKMRDKIIKNLRFE